MGDEDEIIDFSNRFPPKPPVIDTVRPPLVGTTIPPVPPLKEKASKRRSHSRNKKEIKEQQKLEKRDFLVDCILNDGMPSRSTTPRKLKEPSRSSSKGPTPAGIRPHSISHFDVETPLHSATPSKPVTPRNGAPPTLIKGNPKKDEMPCVPSLPQLHGKHTGSEKSKRGFIASGSLSARSWRTKASVGLYA